MTRHEIASAIGEGRFAGVAGILRWGEEAVATDATHHLVLVLATGAAHDAIDRG